MQASSDVGVMAMLSKWLPLLIPIIILEFVLMIAAILDLVRRERVRGGNKWIWAIVIVFLNLFGPLIYFIAGREE